MRLVVKFKIFILLVALVAVSFALEAQSLEDAQKAYNAGITANTEGNTEEAISQFNSCIEMCQVLYDEEEDEIAEELMYSVQAVVPGLYMKLGSEQIQNKQEQAGLDNLYIANELAGSYGDTDTEAKTKKVIPQVHYKLGASKYKTDDFEGALAEFDKALAVNPDFVSAYYLKTVVYKKQGNDELLKSTALKGIEVAGRKNDAKNKAKIVKLAKGHFLKKGNDAKGASKYDKALTNLNTALEFAPNDATALYLVASIYNAKGEYSNAIKAGKKAVANEKGGEEAQAKIYMVIAEAQVKKGDTASACSTYKKAAVGQYAELANYKIEHELKCE